MATMEDMYSSDSEIEEAHVGVMVDAYNNNNSSYDSNEVAEFSDPYYVRKPGLKQFLIRVE